jgi:hypothetical protein
MMIDFNDTPEGLVVDIEVVAGVPYKGYDKRAPTDGYLMAAGMNEVFTAPLVGRQKNSMDWEESINAITRHAIEEFSNLQHFVPYLYEKYTILGKAGINWVPTLGTWLQYNKFSLNDGASIGFYNMLAALAKKQIPINSTSHTALISKGIDLANSTFQSATAVKEALNVAKAQATYVPLSNALTQYAYEKNKANGAHPEVDVTVGGITRAAINSATNGSYTANKEALTQAIHNVLAATSKSVTVTTGSSNSSGSDNSTKGWVHSLGKGIRVATSG